MNAPAKIAAVKSATFPLPKPISVNSMYVNRKVKGRRGRMLSQRYMTWRNSAGWTLLEAGPAPKFTGQVRIAMLVSEKGVGLMDLDNTAKAYLDLFVHMQVIPDDNRKFVRAISLEWTSAAQGICEVTEL